MKIKLTNYPYGDHNVGDICDFGQEKNTSLVSMQRAVWFEPPNPLSKLFTPPPPTPDTTDKPEPEEEEKPQPTKKKTKKSKKLITNELAEAVQEKKAEIEAETKESQPAKPTKKSIWDRLK